MGGGYLINRVRQFCAGLAGVGSPHARKVRASSANARNLVAGYHGAWATSLARHGLMLIMEHFVRPTHEMLLLLHAPGGHRRHRRGKVGVFAIMGKSRSC